MIAKCVKCDKEYQLYPGEIVRNFQCDCGGNLVKSGYDKSSKMDLKDNYTSGLSTEGQKRDLLSRGYTLIDENNKEYVFKKEVSGLPVWVFILLSIVLFPIGIIISLFLYFFYRKPKLKTVEKVEGI
jgi:hypothetical protein